MIYVEINIYEKINKKKTTINLWDFHTISLFGINFVVSEIIIRYNQNRTLLISVSSLYPCSY